MADRVRDEDGTVWFVSCFYVHRSARHRGTSRRLLEGVVELARTCGANAVEGLPRAAGDRTDPVSAYVGAETVFEAAGFTVVARPSPRRVLMRRALDE
jgi:GNAT superfamily N-acetyltransferase